MRSDYIGRLRVWPSKRLENTVHNLPATTHHYLTTAICGLAPHGATRKSVANPLRRLARRMGERFLQCFLKREVIRVEPQGLAQFGYSFVPLPEV